MNLIFDGHSLTSNGLYANVVIAALQPAYSAIVAASGQSAIHMRQFARSRIYPLRKAGEVNIVIAWEYSNSIALGLDAASSYWLMKNFCLECKTEGFKLVVVAPTPRSFAGTPAGFEADRQAILSTLRAEFDQASGFTNVFLPGGLGFYADSFADIAADNRIGDAGDENDTNYYLDKLHMVQAGYNIVAGIVKDAINALP